MSEPTFSSPSVEVAEMNRIQFELEYTEGISQRMRIPETLKVGPDHQAVPLPLQEDLLGSQTTIMQVPERIVVAGEDGDLSFTHPRDLDLIQSVPPVDLLNMKAPPRILTLTEQPLDSLETDPSGSSHNNRSHGVRFRGGSQRGGGTNGNSSGHPTSDKNKSDASATPSPSAHPVRVCPPLCSPEDANGHVFTASGFMAYVQSTTRRAYQQVLEVLEDSHNRSNLDLSLEVNHDETGLIDASTLRRQIVKLNRRLQLLEEENKERSKREVILYSATVAFWLLNTWMWFRR